MTLQFSNVVDLDWSNGCTLSERFWYIDTKDKQQLSHKHQTQNKNHFKQIAATFWFQSTTALFNWTTDCTVNHYHCDLVTKE